MTTMTRKSYCPSIYIFFVLLKFPKIQTNYQQMAQDESKNLKKYFENDPPSFFDELAVKEGKMKNTER